MLEIGRLERALGRHARLEERLFTDREREYAAARRRPARHLAARFCAKEAVAKALGLARWSFRDVEVIAGEGAPEVELYGAAAQRARELWVTPRISLTHERSVAAAAAVLSPAGDTEVGPDNAASAPAARSARTSGG